MSEGVKAEADSPAAYYPGNAYVDWVGADFYGKSRSTQDDVYVMHI